MQTSADTEMAIMKGAVSCPCRPLGTGGTACSTGPRPHGEAPTSVRRQREADENVGAFPLVSMGSNG